MGYQEDFINQIVPHIQAWRNFLGYGVASAITAQACLESAFGRSNKAKNYNNFFGLKYKENRVDCNDGYFTDTSSEQLPDGTYIKITAKWFSFPDMHEGVHGYFEFVDIPRYAGIKKATDPETYLSILKDGGYATSINYVTNCMAIVTKYNLTQYDEVKPMYSNSPLVDYVLLSPLSHGYGLRNHAIDRITIHHAAMNCTVETLGRCFNGTRKATSNYGIGNDGRIGMYCEEKNAAGTSSNKTNDERAITIEVSNEICAPYWTISAAAMTSLINLCVDICKRNNIKQLVWSDNKNDRINQLNGANMTKHKDFAATSCPGPFIEHCLPMIALAVNQQLISPASSYVINGLDYSPVFDPEFYYNKYPDLQLAIGYNTGALWEHFKTFGMNEARQGSADFDPKYYRAHYSDLDAAFGESWPSYYAHFIMFGKNEGRKGAP